MRRIEITIDTMNAAFDPEPTVEIARILTDAACQIQAGDTRNRNIRDINGNICGRIVVRD
jgi:hypothetical protein